MKCNRGSERRKQIQRRMAVLFLVMCTVAMPHVRAQGPEEGQEKDALQFDVSNPKHLEWSTEEAQRIYDSACELVARSVRPEKPPRLKPKFLLVLGARENETLRNGAVSEIRLKVWDAPRFAEAMVLTATRALFDGEELSHLTRDTLRAARATVSVRELEAKK